VNEAVLHAFAGAADAALTPEQQAEIATRQSGLCFDCSEPLTPRRIHGHLIPRSKGGVHTLHNRIAVCGTCEARRGARMPTIAERTKQGTLILQSVSKMR
jgi:5-methylcytosine-specific restriction endonuclease McrA